MVARRSPQEKKALSYARDRRNDYGENDKSSRKNIRRNKRIPNRADRHRERRTLASATGPVSPEAAEHAEVELRVKKSMWITKRWRKWRDAPLGEIVTRKLGHRVEKGMANPVSTERRLARIRERTGSAE